MFNSPGLRTVMTDSAWYFPPGQHQTIYTQISFGYDFSTNCKSIVPQYYMNMWNLLLRSRFATVHFQHSHDLISKSWNIAWCEHITDKNQLYSLYKLYSPPKLWSFFSKSFNLKIQRKNTQKIAKFSTKESDQWGTLKFCLAFLKVN